MIGHVVVIEREPHAVNCNRRDTPHGDLRAATERQSRMPCGCMWSEAAVVDAQGVTVCARCSS